jgi:NAD(P)H-dependent flavin oxidoreductase YrpB (nitropropane dioxygenase family)
MRGARRFSQAISEGDGISLLADVTDAGTAREAESHGAEGIVARAGVSGLREATVLPILWYPHGSYAEALAARADACVVSVEGLEDENGRLESLYRQAIDAGLDCVVAVRDEDQLQIALERLDPEIFLLRAPPAGEGLEHVLGLLPDVPAGKLAVAEVELTIREEVEDLERAGIDAVIVSAADVKRLVGEPALEP